MTEINLKFKAIDYWNRPVYQVEGTEILVGSTEILFPDQKLFPNNTIEEMNEYFRNNTDKLCIFGTNIEDDPLGTSIKKSLKINIL